MVRFNRPTRSELIPSSFYWKKDLFHVTLPIDTLKMPFPALFSPCTSRQFFNMGVTGGSFDPPGVNSLRSRAEIVVSQSIGRTPLVIFYFFLYDVFWVSFRHMDEKQFSVRVPRLQYHLENFPLPNTILLNTTRKVPHKAYHLSLLYYPYLFNCNTFRQAWSSSPHQQYIPPPDLLPFRFPKSTKRLRWQP